MVLSEKDILSFQELYKTNFQVDLAKEDAYTQTVKLIELVRVVYQPMTKEDYMIVTQENEN